MAHANVQFVALFTCSMAQFGSQEELAQLAPTCNLHYCHLHTLEIASRAQYGCGGCLQVADMGITRDRAEAACVALERGDVAAFLAGLNDADVAAWKPHSHRQIHCWLH